MCPLSLFWCICYDLHLEGLGQERYPLRIYSLLKPPLEAHLDLRFY
jgi:hypothetical protein